MKLLKRSLVLSCGVSASAIVLAINAEAASFIIVNGQTETTTQTLDTTGNIGTVEEGDAIDVASGNGIEGTAGGVTVNNAGSVASGDASGISADNSGNTITNSGDAHRAKMDFAFRCKMRTSHCSASNRTIAC